MKLFYIGSCVMNQLAGIEIRVVHAALNGEYCAQAVYDQMFFDFGKARPLSKVRQAEARPMHERG